MEVEILLYDGVEELDAIGPLDVLGGAGFDARLVTLGESRSVTTAHGATFVAAAPLGAAPALLVVPGGGYASRSPRGAWAEARRGVLPAAIAARFRS
ncbi:MAG: DJ-1/PfpI family protein, partial [Candidatus Dormibacteraceae bacterium]